MQYGLAEHVSWMLENYLIKEISPKQLKNPQLLTKKQPTSGHSFWN